MQNQKDNTFLNLHDTHGHLDLLLEHLKIVNFKESRGEIEITDPNFKEEIDKLLMYHEFFTQATISAQNFEMVHKIFNENKKVHFLIGSHPETVGEKFDVENYVKEQEEILKGFDLKNVENKIAGIGEIGLDYYHNHDENVHKKQQNLFRKQIELALNLGFSIQIHSRNAFKDTIKIIKDYPEIYNKFSFHCFSEGVVELKEILDLGGFIGIGGVSSYKNATNVIEAAKYCPVENFMLETDLPFLAPPPFRGKTNLPNMIEIIGKNLADLKGVSEAEIWEKSKENFAKLFNYKV